MLFNDAVASWESRIPKAPKELVEPSCHDKKAYLVFLENCPQCTGFFINLNIFRAWKEPMS